MANLISRSHLYCSWETYCALLLVHRIHNSTSSDFYIDSMVKLLWLAINLSNIWYRLMLYDLVVSASCYKDSIVEQAMDYADHQTNTSSCFLCFSMRWILFSCVCQALVTTLSNYLHCNWWSRICHDLIDLDCLNANCESYYCSTTNNLLSDNRIYCVYVKALRLANAAMSMDSL